MKTRNLFFMFVLSIMIQTPLFANIDANSISPVCDYSALGAYSGTARMVESWSPNNISINWINNGTTNVSTCTYNSSFTVPSVPANSKPGYVFTGWKLKEGCDVSNVDVSDSLLTAFGNIGGMCMFEDIVNETGDTIDCSDSRVSDLNSGEVRLGYSHGDITMKYSCNATIPEEPEEIPASLVEAQEAYDAQCDTGEELTEEQQAECEELSMALNVQSLLLVEIPAIQRNFNTFDGTETGANCWCKAIKYKPSGGNQCDLQTPWVYVDTVYDNDSPSSSACAEQCLSGCFAIVLDSSGAFFWMIMLGMEIDQSVIMSLFGG